MKEEDEAQKAKAQKGRVGHPVDDLAMHDLSDVIRDELARSITEDRVKPR